MVPSPGEAATSPRRKNTALSQDVAALLSTAKTSATDSAKPKRKRRVARIIRPEPGSLYDIMHDHAGEALYVIPLCWTDAHARLLGVKFIDRDPVLKPVPDLNLRPSRHLPRPSLVAQDLAKNLTLMLSHPPARSSGPCIAKIMEMLLPALCSGKTSVDLDCYFGAQMLERAVRAAVLWTPTSDLGIDICRIPSSWGGSEDGITNAARNGTYQPPSLPVLAFVNRSHVAWVRRNLYRVAPRSTGGNQQNAPVANLQRLRSKRLVPKNADHDSYIVATMLAMAQSQCYPPRSKPSSMRSSFTSSQATEASPEPAFRDVPVIIISQDSDAADFVVYRAIVSANFLKRFAEPTKAPVANAMYNGGLEIEVTRVPIWPVLGLKERLSIAVDICGAASLNLVGNDDYDTWELPQDRERRLNSLKRPRDSVTDPFYTSFDSTNGDELPRRDLCASALAGDLNAAVPSTSPTSPRTPKRRRTKAINELEVC